MGAYYRAGIDVGIDKVKAWLLKWYGEPFDLSLSAFTIDCDTITVSDMLEIQNFLSNEKGGQSDYHAFLKAITKQWLLQNGTSMRDIDFEVRSYFPIEELTEGITVVCDGVRINIDRAQILPKGSDFPLNRGQLIIMDMYSKGRSIEVGYTTPFSLLTPLLEGLAQEAIWIPYCRGISTKSFDLASNRPTQVTAYVISNQQHTQTVVKPSR